MEWVEVGGYSDKGRRVLGCRVSVDGGNNVVRNECVCVCEKNGFTITMQGWDNTR
jgi:hypothetical protein